MHSVAADADRNRLYIRLVGFFSVDEIRKCNEEIFAATKALKPGYRVVTDISEYKAGSPEVAREIEAAQAHFVSTGAGMGVRILGPSGLSGMQLKRTAGEAGYSSTNVETMEDAERLLSGSS
jgi:hypothetical protein